MRSTRVSERELQELQDWFNPTKLTPRKLWSGLQSFGIATSTIIVSNLLIYACQLYTKDELTMNLMQVGICARDIDIYAP